MYFRERQRAGGATVGEREKEREFQADSALSPDSDRGSIPQP